MLVVKSLSLTFYDREILRDISFNISPGERIAILGSNGCGKTSLLKCLVNVYKANGTITLNGEPIHKIKKLYRYIGYVPQNPLTMFFEETVEREIAVVLKSMKLPEEKVRMMVKDIARKLHIEHLLDKSPFKLSGGEQKRVSIASIAVYRPEYLLMDEPTNDVDFMSIKAILDFIEDYRGAVIVATHDTNFAKYFDRILIMNHGHIVYDGGREILDDSDFMISCNIRPLNW